MIEYSTTAPALMTEPGMIMLSRTTAPGSTVTPAQRMVKSHIPSTKHPSVTIEFCTLAQGDM